MVKLKAVTDKTISNAKPGVHNIEPNLILRVSNTGSRSWVFRYQAGGKVRQIGMGGYPAKTLASARDEAAKMREAIAEGREPVESKAKAETFETYALAYIGKFEAGWKTPSTGSNGETR